jgi:hypothetical protein
MSVAKTKPETVRDQVAAHVLGMISSLTQEMDLAPITLESCLGDTGLDSVSVAYLIGEIQQHYRMGDGLYKALVRANFPILKTQVGTLVDLVCEGLAQGDRAVAGGVR